jgi:hypothetical protein
MEIRTVNNVFMGTVSIFVNRLYYCVGQCMSVCVLLVVVLCVYLDVCLCTQQQWWVLLYPSPSLLCGGLGGNEALLHCSHFSF